MFAKAARSLWPGTTRALSTGTKIPTATLADFWSSMAHHRQSPVLQVMNRHLVAALTARK